MSDCVPVTLTLRGRDRRMATSRMLCANSKTLSK